ncbi:hypothetical protein MW183_002944 [Listeria monocytogenes]|nr:hypothetical protein [Listeria monocytogenes]EJB2521802.1 hypothetical protein [Listeria monocytogenes]EJB2690134.1 hypothetical protein [Listeria monocytogenes]EJE4582933.1 hypothetical protein [Listeria monocytogenes]
MKEKISEVKSYLTEKVIEIAVINGTDAAKEVANGALNNGALEIISDFGIDVIGGSIPGIGNAISSFRIKKQIKNLEVMVMELRKKTEEIKKNFDNQSEDNKILLDDIFAMVINKIADTTQEEKIKYMINGFANLTEIQNVSYDIAYLYYDALDRLSILDISVLELSYSVWVSMDVEKSYQDILDEFDIDIDQYHAVQSNLERIGLLENQYNAVLEKDIKSVVDKLNDLQKVVLSIQTSLSQPKKKMKDIKSKNEVKIKAKERLKISKYGKHFIEFFIEQNTK